MCDSQCKYVSCVVNSLIQAFKKTTHKHACVCMCARKGQGSDPEVGFQAITTIPPGNISCSTLAKKRGLEPGHRGINSSLLASSALAV